MHGLEKNRGSPDLPESEDITEFIEDGEIIQMEINDGGAAAQEFQSDYDSAESESESEDESSQAGTEAEVRLSEAESESEPERARVVKRARLSSQESDRE